MEINLQQRQVQQLQTQHQIHMKNLRKRRTNIINISICSVILFSIIWSDSDLKTAFNFTLFIVSTSVFIFNMIYSYQIIKKNRFYSNNHRWWIYFSQLYTIST